MYIIVCHSCYYLFDRRYLNVLLTVREPRDYNLMTYWRVYDILRQHARKYLYEKTIKMIRKNWISFTGWRRSIVLFVNR